MKHVQPVFLSVAAVLIASNYSPTDAQAASGFCSQPMAPTSYLTKPRKPFCATTRSCDDWQVQAYRNEVSRYFNNLRNYADDLDRYYSNAVDYIECMSDLD